jgi:hypothetical protein
MLIHDNDQTLVGRKYQATLVAHIYMVGGLIIGEIKCSDYYSLCNPFSQVTPLSWGARIHFPCVKFTFLILISHYIQPTFVDTPSRRPDKHALIFIPELIKLLYMRR